MAALLLGWRLAQLYDRDTLPPPAAPDSGTKALPSHLPGASEATDYDRAALLIDQAESALQALLAVFGESPPTLEPLRAALCGENHERDDVRAVILDVHKAIGPRLAAADERLERAYGLGRVLADTVWLPRSKQPLLYKERFDHYRLANAHGWLADLEVALPRQASPAVQAGLTRWENWVHVALDSADAAPELFDESVLRALRAQGECWRRLLVGEKDPASLLTTNHYVAAARSLLRRGRAIAFSFLWSWAPWIVILATGAAAAIWAAATYAPHGSGRLIAVLGSVAATVGISWKGASATLGKTLGRAEAALWSAEVGAAIGEAATILPNGQKSRGGRSGIQKQPADSTAIGEDSLTE